MRYCSTCGTALSEDAKFCPGCGIATQQEDRDENPIPFTVQRESESPAQPPSGVWWIFARGFLFTLLFILLGGLTEVFRSGMGFVPGIQGLLLGSVLAWGSGKIATRDQPVYWSPGQRFWFWLHLSLVFCMTQLFVLSSLNAAPLASPLTWLSDIANGYEEEYFFGGAPLRQMEGLLSGGWWIFFVLLDLIFFFFLGLIIWGAALNPDADVTESEDTPTDFYDQFDEEEVQDEGDEATPTPPGPNFAKTFTLIFWMACLLAFFAFSGWTEWQQPDPFNMEAIGQLKPWEGTYHFDDGKDLLSVQGTSGACRLLVTTANEFYLISEPEGSYRISLHLEYARYEGLLYRNSSMIPVRAVLSEDGRSIQLSGPAYRMGMAEGDVLITLRKG